MHYTMKSYIRDAAWCHTTIGNSSRVTLCGVAMKAIRDGARTRSVAILFYVASIVSAVEYTGGRGMVIVPFHWYKA